MSQAGRTGGNQELRAEIMRLVRDGLPVDRGTLAARYGVSQRAVTVLRREVGPVIAAATDGANRRTVQNFDGAKLNRLRRGQNPSGLWFTQEQLGKLAHRSRGAIGHLENDLRKPTIVTLNLIADALGVDPSDLLRGEEGYEPARHGPARLGGHDHKAAS